VSEPRLERAVACPQCGGMAEPEEDGQAAYHVCTECDAEFGYRLLTAGPVCAAGLEIRADARQPPGVMSLESGGQRASVFIGSIGKRPE
jgi:hypothetical protein